MTDHRRPDFSAIPPPMAPRTETTPAASGFEFGEIRIDQNVERSPSPEAARKLNTRLGACLAAIVLLAPIPVGSNRPIFWMIWAAILGLLAAGYFLSMAVADPNRPLQIKKFKLIISLGVLLPVAGLLQLLPVTGPPIATLPDEMGPLGLTLSVDATRLGVLRLSSYAILFVLTLEIATNASRVKTLAWAVFIGVIAHALWGLFALTVLGDIALWGAKVAYDGVATGSFINRNSFATFLGMGFSLGIALVMSRGRTRNVSGKAATMFGEDGLITLAGWTGVLVIAVAIATTQSRMGLAASAAGGLVVYTVMYTKLHGRLGVALLRSGLLAVGLTGAILVLFGAGTVERSLFLISQSNNRIDIYAQVIGMIAERPLLGYGLDTFRIAYELFHEPPVSTALIWENAHNTYLTLWVEAGLVAGTLPMLGVVLVVIRLLGIIRRRKSGFAVPVAALGAITVGALHSLVDFSLEIEANALLLIFVAALGLGQLRRRQSDT